MMCPHYHPNPFALQRAQAERVCEHPIFRHSQESNFLKKCISTGIEFQTHQTVKEHPKDHSCIKQVYQGVYGSVGSSTFKTRRVGVKTEATQQQTETSSEIQMHSSRGKLSTIAFYTDSRSYRFKRREFRTSNEAAKATLQAPELWNNQRGTSGPGPGYNLFS